MSVIACLNPECYKISDSPQLRSRFGTVVLFLMVLILIQALVLTDRFNVNFISSPYDANDTVTPYKFDPPDFQLYNSSKSKNCVLCNFASSDRKSDSTPHDVVMTHSVGKFSNLLPFVRSLRSTGANCSIVIFVSLSDYKPYANQMKAAEECGVQFVYVDIPKNLLKNSRFHVFIPFYYDFIFKNKNKIHRILKCDLFDTLFQLDPFNDKYFKNNTFFMYKEKSNGYHCRTQVKLSKTGSTKGWFDRTYYCAGVYGAEAQHFLDLMKIYMDIVHPTKYSIEVTGTNISDQDIFNYLINTGHFSNHDFMLAEEQEPNYQSIRHFWWYHLRKQEKKDKLGYIKQYFNSSEIVPIIHHVHMESTITEKTKEACPPEAEYLNYLPKQANRWQQTVRAILRDGLIFNILFRGPH